MKAKDLVVGMEIYANNQRDWATFRYGASKVTVKDVKPQHWSWSTSKQEHIGREWSSGSSTLGILVVNTQGGEEVRTLASLRGPYAETKAAVEAAAQKRNEAAYAAEILSKMVHSLRDAVAEKAGKIGIRTMHSSLSTSLVSVSVEQFKAMVDALDAQGWKYEGGK